MKKAKPLKPLLFKEPYQKTEYKTSEKERERKRKQREANKEKYNAYRRKYYQENKEAHKKIVNEVKNRYRKAWAEYKATLSCTKCGENHPATLDFHHVERHPDNQKVHKLIGAGSFRKAIAEARDRCIVLCANCHRKHHYEEELQKKTPTEAGVKTTEESPMAVGQDNHTSSVADLSP